MSCWGWNGEGQVGDSAANPQLVPTPVGRLGADVASIDAGDRHTCALTTAGSVLCWGANRYGQLGDGTAAPLNRLTPTPVGGLEERPRHAHGRLRHTRSLDIEGR